MSDPNAIATQFVTFYYNTFDQGRNQLASLYRPQSMLSFEGQQFSGVEGIVQKLMSLPFTKVQHKVSTIDAQPSNPQTGSILIFVTGQLLVDDEKNPQFFSQSFQLFPDAGNWFVYNDIFRLNYA